MHIVTESATTAVLATAVYEAKNPLPGEEKTLMVLSDFPPGVRDRLIIGKMEFDGVVPVTPDELENVIKPIDRLELIPGPGNYHVGLMTPNKIESCHNFPFAEDADLRPFQIIRHIIRAAEWPHRLSLIVNVKTDNVPFEIVKDNEPTGFCSYPASINLITP